MRLWGPKGKRCLLLESRAEGTCHRHRCQHPPSTALPGHGVRISFGNRMGGKRQWGEQKNRSPSPFMIWFLSKVFDVDAESAKASKFGVWEALSSRALGPSCLSHRQASGVWLAEPHGKAVPAPLLSSGERSTAVCTRCLSTPQSQRDSVSQRGGQDQAPADFATNQATKTGRRGLLLRTLGQEALM